MKDGEREGPEQRKQYLLRYYTVTVARDRGTLLQGHLKEEHISH